MTASDVLAGAGVATVYEAAGRVGLVDVPLIQVLPGTRVAGGARTVLCGQDDNRAVHVAIARLQPGEILIATMPEPAPVALVGELLATQAKGRGAAGLLVDAAVRDTEELRRLGLPVWARWVRVRGADKLQPGALDVPVTVGGAAIAPGDVVVLDADGAVVVAASALPATVTAVQARLDSEAALRERFLRGELSYDIYGFGEPDR